MSEPSKVTYLKPRKSEGTSTNPATDLVSGLLKTKEYNSIHLNDKSGTLHIHITNDQFSSDDLKIDDIMYRGMQTDLPYNTEEMAASIAETDNYQEPNEPINKSNNIMKIEKDIKRLNDGISSLYQMMKSGGNGGGGMDDLSKRVDQLERGYDSLDSRLKSIESKLDKIPTSAEMELLLHKTIAESVKNIPTESKVKEIIRDINKSDEIASKTYVSDSMNSAKNQLILWIIGTAITISGIVAGIIIKLH